MPIRVRSSSTSCLGRRGGGAPPPPLQVVLGGISRTLILPRHFGTSFTLFREMAAISVKFVINFCIHFGNCKIKIISFSWFCFSYPFCRNPVSSQMQQGGNGRGQERIIDLHGLHVSEAIHVLKRDLAMLRSAAARSGEQRLQVYICVGTGHHTRGSRTPARLPTAVQRYLLEEEGLDFTEPQPGLLRVVIY